MKEKLVTIKVREEDREKIKNISKETGLKYYTVITQLLEGE